MAETYPRLGEVNKTPGCLRGYWGLIGVSFWLILAHSWLIPIH